MQGRCKDDTSQQNEQPGLHVNEHNPPVESKRNSDAHTVITSITHGVFSTMVQR